MLHARCTIVVRLTRVNGLSRRHGDQGKASHIRADRALERNRREEKNGRANSSNPNSLQEMRDATKCKTGPPCLRERPVSPRPRKGFGSGAEVHLFLHTRCAIVVRLTRINGRSRRHGDQGKADITRARSDRMSEAEKREEERKRREERESELDPGSDPDLPQSHTARQNRET